MDIRGPAEVSQAAQAFNQMQQRIREHVSERTRILAAISHDLQTPMRVAFVRNSSMTKTCVHASRAISTACRHWSGEGLAYARSLNEATPAQPIDLDSLLEALCDDARDMGWTLSLSGRVGALARTTHGRATRTMEPDRKRGEVRRRRRDHRQHQTRT